MKDKLTITISDAKGSKHYQMRRSTKKMLLYFAVFLAFVSVVGTGLIYFLMHQVVVLENKKHRVVQEYTKVEQNNQKLKIQMEQKAQEYDEIKEKINNIEELIGLTPDTTQEITVRLDTLTLTSQQQHALLRNIPNGSPVPLKRITGKFGWRIHPVLKKKEFHKGIDLQARRHTPVRAPADGVVEYAGYHKSSGFGYLIIIDHNFGFKTMYGHLSKKMRVKAGTFVKKDQIIGYTGNSGLSTGPHLHYEVRFISRPLNPYPFIKWNNNDFKSIFKKERRVPWESLIAAVTQKFYLYKQFTAPSKTTPKSQKVIP
ncbi:M23 family metallopeptidase [Sulfurospirillum sp. 1612]|uniref:M23 family metallopeptidase n=1 Tax=Sulfurospirillum sp. 1612 TaxID=3094835 RepID=UPI002F9503B5